MIDWIPQLAAVLESGVPVRLRVRRPDRSMPFSITGRVRVFEPPDHPFGIIVEHRADDGSRRQSTFLLGHIESLEVVTD
jgi:hypothetical protein